MNLALVIYTFILFFILSPSVLIRLPKNGSKYTVAAVHALLFGLIFYFTQFFMNKFFHIEEGLATTTTTVTPARVVIRPATNSPSENPPCSNWKNSGSGICIAKLRPGDIAPNKCEYTSAQLPVCPSGSFTSGHCPNKQTTPLIPCPDGYYFDLGQKKCLSNAPACPKGFTYNKNSNKCAWNEPVCPDGFSYDKTKNNCKGLLWEQPTQSGVPASCT